jgi:nicotinamidase-related amidase
VIIDMQRDFLEPGGFGESLGNDVSLLRRTIAPTRRLLDAARAVGLMVIHTREGHRADLADLPPAKKTLAGDHARGERSQSFGYQLSARPTICCRPQKMPPVTLCGTPGMTLLLRSTEL